MHRKVFQVHDIAGQLACLSFLVSPEPSIKGQDHQTSGWGYENTYDSPVQKVHEYPFPVGFNLDFASVVCHGRNKDGFKK